MDNQQSVKRTEVTGLYTPRRERDLLHMEAMVRTQRILLQEGLIKIG